MKSVVSLGDVLQLGCNKAQELCVLLEQGLC